MSPATSSILRELVAALPTIEPHTELILRTDADGATATLRPEDAPPRIFAHANGRVVELDPAADGGLPGSALLADAGALQELLRPHVGVVATARLVAWRPGRRAVVRVLDERGAAHWLKLFDRRGHRRAARAFAAIGATTSPMSLLTPTAGFDAECAFLTGSAPGTSLRTLLANGAPAPLTTIARGVAALAYTEVHGDAPLFDFVRARDAAIDLLGKAAAVRADLHGLAAGLASMPAVPGPRPAGFVHGDLHDKQLFVDGERTHLIDLEGFGIGDPRFDVVNLAEHVRLRDLQRTARDTGLGDTILARNGLLPTDEVALAFRAVVRARLCGVYALRPRWRHLVDRLVTETSTALEQLQ